ncbi:MAG: hypothetical protein Q9220_004850 [cf. Caloplaca sp. 1 TL-2023]
MAPKRQIPKVPATDADAVETIRKEDDLPSLLTSDMVTCYLGPKRKAYPVHRRLLLSSSTTFETHFGSLDAKDPVTTMYLTNKDPAVFEVFLGFLYRRCISSTDITRLLKLYILGWDWGISEMQNLCIDQLRDLVVNDEKPFSLAQLTTIYDKFPTQGAPLRRLAVDSFNFCIMRKSVATEVRKAWLRKRSSVGQLDFVLDICEAMVAAPRNPAPVNPGKKGKCAYHEHKEGAECAD